MAQLIPSITGKPTDQWVNHYFIKAMDTVLVTPYGILANDAYQTQRIDEIISQSFEEIIIDNCAYSIFKGYLDASPIERFKAQIRLAKMCKKAKKVTVVVPDFVQEYDKTKSTYELLENMMRGIDHDRIRLMYVLQGDFNQMVDLYRYIQTLPFPADIAVATQERRQRKNIEQIRGLLKSIDRRTHLFGETRKWVLDMLGEYADSYDTSIHFWNNWKAGHRGQKLFENIAADIAGALNSNYFKFDALKHLI